MCFSQNPTFWVSFFDSLLLPKRKFLNYFTIQPFYKFNLLRLILFPVTESIFSKRYFKGKNGVFKFKKLIVKIMSKNKNDKAKAEAEAKAKT